MFSIQYFTFVIIKLFQTSGIKLIKLSVRINVSISNSDSPYKVPDIYTKLIF